MTTKPTTRLTELDGIRGWASLAVLFFHVFWESFGVRHAGFRNAFTAFFFNGQLAVCIFFVLSGEALSISYFLRADKKSLARMIVKRYSRLTIPILFSCTFIFILMKSGLVYADEAAKLLSREDWLGAVLQFKANLGEMLRYSFAEVYSAGAEHSYNPFLWTMSVEMIGSIVVFALLFTKEYLRRPALVFFALAVALIAMSSYFGCFMAGILFARLRSEGVFARLQTTSRIQPFCWIGILIVAAAASWTKMHGHDGVPPRALAPLLLFLVFSNLSLSNFFAKARISQVLGKLSFPLYLVHFGVIVSLMSFLVIKAANSYGLSPAAIWSIALITVVASIGAAAVFEPVERLTHLIGNKVSRRLLSS